MTSLSPKIGPIFADFLDHGTSEEFLALASGLLQINEHFSDIIGRLAQLGKLTVGVRHEDILIEV